MPLGRLLSEFEKGRISCLCTSGMSNRKIAAKIGRSPTVVDNYLRDPENYCQKHGGGRQKAMTDKSERKFLRDLSTNGRSINETSVKRSECIEVKQELKMALFESWEEFSQSYIKSLVDSMPRRVFDLILKRGHKIDY